VLASNDDCGHDVQSVEALQRKHDGLGRDAVGAIVPVVATLKAEAERLASKFPGQAEAVSRRSLVLTALNEKMLNVIASRERQLSDAHDLQQLFQWSSYLLSWVRDMTKRIESQQLAADTTGAQDLLQTHQKLKSEIDARKHSFEEVYAFGDRLVAANHYAANEVSEKVSAVRNAQTELLALWDAARALYEQSFDALLFRETAQQADSWVIVHETIFANQASLESIDLVNASMNKLQDLLKTLAAQEDRFHALRRLVKVRSLCLWLSLLFAMAVVVVVVVVVMVVVVLFAYAQSYLYRVL
jgi:hypothetical protein